MSRQPYFLRKMHSAKSRLRLEIQHRLLQVLEKTPAPLCFAFRNYFFRALAPLFKETKAFAKWQAAVDYFDIHRSSQIQVVDIQKIPAPESLRHKKIAVHAHLFYPDLAPELAHMLTHFPAPFDLLISTPDSQNEGHFRKQFQGMDNLKKLQVIITPNRGRDLGPMLYGFGKQLLEYDYFAHVHTKKSANSNDIGNAWRKYLIKGLFDSSNNRIQKILGLLETYGLVYPQKFPLIDVQNCQWGDNLPAANQLCATMHIPLPDPGYIEFPVGSMFWAKTAALKPLLEHPFALEDFEIEAGQTDHTIMHAIERSLTLICLTQGYPVALLRNPCLLSFYP
jgi:lipopolysaccharide biosynthesis protein